ESKEVPADRRPALPGYEIVGELGRGGMGVVYLARHERLKRLVALKTVPLDARADPEHKARLDAEAQSLARLAHPNVVQVHALEEHEGQLFLALEYVDGGSLHTRLGGSPLPPRSAASLVEDLAKALHAAHEKGIVHRDLKPQNVLLPAGSWLPKVTDFGLAK